VLEHAFAMLDFPAVQTPGVGSVQARGMAFQPILSPRRARHEANDHEDHVIVPV